ncbi:activating transcription factor 7-interacting protein 1 isoform X2 [Homalodisca vitripennis]|uniref:activating transcription factor 7-interacting protein 1 isoform X2 n=1 Tax=Homalodisca vitripennis TaxID=197043 RepID=UPI001EEA9313|nr:activating transcription factor 7-interacting protein 1 isoform X2 [Homalodisca vitripennis]
MKLIENTVEAENLETSISHEDLDGSMASCETVMVNSQSSPKESSLDKSIVEKLSSNTKITNGIHEKDEDQSKCNGNMNGFCEDISDDEFQLVLESSSDDGGSPLKKIDEDTISAPQIVQEIEDLLGIDSGSVGIDEEIEKELNGTESIELSDKYDNVSENSENANTPQEIKDVFEDDIHVHEKAEETIEKEKDCGENNEIKRPTEETTECDSSSNMNLVFDEIEIGTQDSADSQDEETIAAEKLAKVPRDKTKIVGTELSQSTKVESTIENGVELTKSEDQLMNKGINENKEKNMEVDESMVIAIKEDSCEIAGQNEDIPPTSTSLIEKTDSKNLVEMSHDNEKRSEKEETILASTSDIDDTERKSCDETLIKSDGSELKIESEANNAVTSSTKSSSEGDAVRKRTTSIEEEQKELKKPKLENSAEENKSQVLKRRSSDPVEIEVKRTKLSDSVSVNEPLVDSSEEETLTGDCLDIKEGSIDSEKVEERKTKIEEKKTDKTCDKVVKNNPDEDTASSTVQTTDQSEVKPSCGRTEKEMQSNEIDSSPAKLAESSDDISKSSLEKPLNEVSTSDKSVGEQCGNKSSTSKEASEEVVLASTKKLKQKNKKVKENKEYIEVSSSSNSSSSSSSSNISSSSNKNKACAPLVNGSEDISENKEELIAENKSKSAPKATSSRNIIAKGDKVVKANFKTVQPDEDEILKQSNTASSSSKEKEKLVKKSEQSKSGIKSPFGLLTKNMQQAKSVNKKMSNLDLAIESVVDKAKADAERVLPLLKKFHKDQLKKLTRSDLEELVVLKICEAVTDRSEIGQMRLRCQTLEQNNELWRKKALQFEKQNRELEMVLKRFLTETAHNKRENQNKVVVPIKVTRSVGLQVVLASSMHGALVSARSKPSSEPVASTSTSMQSSSGRSISQQQSQQGTSRPKPVERESSKAATFTPPVQPVPNSRPRGRPSRISQTQSQPSSPVSIVPQPSPSKVSPPTTPVKPIASKTALPNKDLEVIDLTDKEEKTKAPSQSPVGGSIRVAPATQMCFVQQNTTNSPPQQMAYFVQKSGQRPQQYLVTTASASPPKAGGATTQRPTPALAVPVFRSGQIIPVQASPQVAVRAPTNTSPATRQLPQAIRLQSQVGLKHPAPLPSAPVIQSKPGFKAPPPKPQLKIAKTVNGIMLSWSMMLTKDMAEMASYQLYAYQEGHQAPTTNLWKKVGDVKALPLPMACTLTQFIDGHRYHFAVRAVDIHGRIGPFSPPSTIMLTK